MLTEILVYKSDQTYMVINQVSTFIWKIHVACPSCFFIFKKTFEVYFDGILQMIFSIQTLKSISNFSNVKRKISEIWRDGRRKAGRNGKRETVGDRKEGEGDWGGDKKSGSDRKRVIDKTRKGSPEKTKKEDRKRRKKVRPEETNKGRPRWKRETHLMKIVESLNKIWKVLNV